MAHAIDLEPFALAIGLVGARVGAVIVSFPAFLSESVPTSVRAMAGLLISGVLCTTIDRPAPHHLAMALAGEVVLGACLGFSARLVAVCIGFTGELFDTSLGYNFSKQINPMTHEDAGPLMNLSQYVATLSFYLVDGHHILLRALSKSLDIFPLGYSDYGVGAMMQLVTHYGEVLSVGMTLAMPLCFSLAVTQACLALLSRVAPQLNIWAVGFTVMSSLGLIALWLYTPAWLHATGSLWTSPGQWISF